MLDTAVYILKHPVTGQVGYVGQSIYPNTRVYAHTYKARHNPESRKDIWMRSILAEGLTPMLEIVEMLPFGGDAMRREQYWIKHYLDAGVNLKNEMHAGFTWHYLPSAPRRTLLAEAKKHGVAVPFLLHCMIEHWAKTGPEEIKFDCGWRTTAEAR